jgi:prepilin-type processing-associated H-X9-DG protein
LVVIAIIAVLSAILFPVVAQARHKAYQAGCASNLRQIAMAVMTYASDWNDRLPLCSSFAPYTLVWVHPSYPPLFGPPYAFLPDVLERYVGSEAVWYCRSMSPSDRVYYKEGMITFGENEGTYTWHHQTCADNPGGPSKVISGSALGLIPQPSEAALVWDARHWGVPNQRGVHPPHFGGLNAAYADGHVEWVSLQGLSQGGSATNNFFSDFAWRGFY